MRARRGRQAIWAWLALLAWAATASTALAQSGPEPMPANGAREVARTVNPGFRWPTAAPAHSQLQLINPDGSVVAGLMQVSGRQAVIEPLAPLVGCTRYTLTLATSPLLRSHFTTACSDWQAPMQIDDGRTAHQVDLPVNGTQVAATRDGGFDAVWFQDDAGRRAILSSRFNPDTQTWSKPQAIDLQGPQAGGSSIPAIAADPQGRLTVVWFQSIDGRSAIFAARSEQDRWSAPQRLDAPALPGNATNPQLATDAEGNVTVVWQQPDGHHTAIYAAHWAQTQQRWLAAQPLDRGKANAYNPVIAAAPQGRVVAAWQQGASGQEAVYVASLQPGGKSWSEPDRLSPAGVAAVMPALVATTQGRFEAAWVQGRDTHRRIAVSPLRSAGLAGAPELMHAPAFNGAALSPVLTADAAGNLTLVWEQAQLTPGGAVRDAILAARLEAGATSWSASKQIDDPALRSAGSPVLATDPAGNVRCAWYQDGPSGMQVQTARFDAAQHRWEAPQTLSDPTSTVQASLPALAVNAAGGVMVVWQQFNGWRTIAVGRWLP